MVPSGKALSSPLSPKHDEKRPAQTTLIPLTFPSSAPSVANATVTVVSRCHCHDFICYCCCCCCSFSFSGSSRHGQVVYIKCCPRRWYCCLLLRSLVCLFVRFTGWLCLVVVTQDVGCWRVGQEPGKTAPPFLFRCGAPSVGLNIF